MGSRTGPRGLQHLSRSARIEQRSDARREAAGPLSELSHRHEASIDDLRRERARVEKQSSDRPQLRQLPRADPRFQQSCRQHVAALRRHDHAHQSSLPPSRRCGCSRPRQAQQQNTPPAEPDQNTGISSLTGGQADFGFRGTGYSDDSDEARYQRYRDLRNGVFLENVRLGKNDDTRYWDVRATHVGYRDQQYAANYNGFGKMKASFAFNADPALLQPGHAHHLHDHERRRPWPERLSCAGAERRRDERDLQHRGEPLRSAIAAHHHRPRFVYSLSDTLDVIGAFKNTQKTGEQPWSGSFGFGNTAELPVPVDTRTTDVGVAAEWNKGRGLVRVGYDGSFFSNSTPTLIWDSPLRSTDTPTSGPARGRETLWPNSNLNSGSISGLFRLPNNATATALYLAGEPDPGRRADSLHDQQRHRVAAARAPDRRRQRATLWRQRSPTPRARRVTCGSARASGPTTSTTTRPSFAVADHGEVRHQPRDDQRELEPVRLLAANAGSRLVVDADDAGRLSRGLLARKERRDVPHVRQDDAEHAAPVGGQPPSCTACTLRGVYEYSKRTGSGLDEQSLDDLGEQTSLRQFDISDFTANRFSAIVIARLGSNLSLNGTGFVGNDDRPDTGFGLLTHDVGGVASGLRLHSGRRGIARRNVSIRELLGAPEIAPGEPGRGVRGSDPGLDDRQRRSHPHLTASADLLKLGERPTSASPTTSCMPSRCMSTGLRQTPRCRR